MWKIPADSSACIRVLTEGAFMTKISALKVQQIMPVLLGIDAVNNLIAFKI
jgi:5-methylthioribose kinase